VSVNGPGDLDLRPFDLETGTKVASKVLKLFAMYETDGQTNGQAKQCFPSRWAGA